MSEKLCKKACANCPRNTLANKALEKVEGLREAQALAATSMMDDELAEDVMQYFHEEGLLDDPEDVVTFRRGFDNAFSLFDMLEENVHQLRQKESEFCVGALTMKALSGSTEYSVTICRSPHNPATGEIQPAVVRKTSC